MLLKYLFCSAVDVETTSRELDGTLYQYVTIRLLKRRMLFEMKGPDVTRMFKLDVYTKIHLRLSRIYYSLPLYHEFTEATIA